METDLTAFTKRLVRGWPFWMLHDSGMFIALIEKNHKYERVRLTRAYR